MKMIILPRQARDKQRENFVKQPFSRRSASRLRRRWRVESSTSPSSWLVPSPRTVARQSRAFGMPRSIFRSESCPRCRKRLFKAFFVLRTRRNIYQDRLGTNVGKVETRCMFCRGSSRHAQTRRPLRSVCEKLLFMHRLMQNPINLPRRARGKHREATQNKEVFSAGHYETTLEDGVCVWKLTGKGDFLAFPKYFNGDLEPVAASVVPPELAAQVRKRSFCDAILY